MHLTSIRTLILSLLFPCLLHSQTTPTDNCGAAKYQLTQALEKEDYSLAAHWFQRGLENCDTLTSSFLKNSSIAYSNLLREEWEKQDKNLKHPRVIELSDTVDFIYSERLKLTDDPKWIESYASFLYFYREGQRPKSDSLYQISIAHLKDDSRASSLRRHFRMSIIQAKSDGLSTETKELLFSKYLELSSYAIKGAEKAQNEKDRTSYMDADNFLDRLMTIIVTDCHQLDTAINYKLSFISDEKIKLKTIERFILYYEDKDCTEADGYALLLDELSRSNPSVSTFITLGLAHYQKEKFQQAKEAFQKALNLSETEPDISNSHYHLGKTLKALRQHKKAVAELKKVTGPYKKDALVLIAKAIALLQCGDSSFERKAVYWLANDYIQKAIRNGATGLDPRMYMDKAPKREDVFNEGLKEGEPYEIKCWGESTIIRF